MTERITAAGKVFIAPLPTGQAGRADAEYGQVELLTNLEDGSAYIRVKGGYYHIDSEGKHSAVGKIADKDAMRRMGLALLALSGFEVAAEVERAHRRATWELLADGVREAALWIANSENGWLPPALKAAIEAAEEKSHK